MRGQRLHAEGLGRVVPGVDNIEPEFLGCRVTPVWTFSGNERVHTAAGDLRHLAPRPTGNHANTLNPPGTAGTNIHVRATDRRRDSLDQIIKLQRQLAAYPDRLRLKVEEGCLLFEADEF